MTTTVDDIIDRRGADAAAGLGVAPRRFESGGSRTHPPATGRPAGRDGLALHDLPGAHRRTDPDALAAAGRRDRALVLGDGAVLWGRGFGATRRPPVGEVCFNTGLTGYQETLTDPSYAGRSSVSPSRISAMSVPTRRP